MRVREKNTPVSKTTENLAKLMASENITVEFKKVSTPSFELNSRTLTLPLWKDISKETYNMLVAHEVGHALYTPTKKWNEVSSTEEMRLATNVVEDARIERSILKKYPGCRSDFLKGYKELHDKDFFGLSKKSADGRSLLDRINLYYKSYGNVYVPFVEEEKVWINRIDNASTFEEVLEIADDLIENSESEDESVDNASHDSSSSDGTEELDSSEDMSETENSGSESNGNDSDSGDDSSSESDNNESDDSDEGDENEETDNEDSSSSADTDSGSNEKDKSFGNANTSIDDSENEEVETSMDSLEKNLNNISTSDSRYADRYSKTVHLVNEGLDNVDFDNLIYPMEEFIKTATLKSHTFFEDYTSNSDINVIGLSEAYTTIRSENLKVVNNMVKTFEMKKSATLNARTMTAKTGLLDMNKLPFYKLTDDIFLQNEVTPKGKNHAIIMYLDMSSSMNGEGMSSALAQIINMIMFCDKVSIPYRVYGFSDRVFPWASWTTGNYRFERKDWKYGLNLEEKDQHYEKGVSNDVGFGLSLIHI